MLFTMLPWSCSKDDFKKTGDHEKRASAVIPPNAEANQATAFAQVVYQIDVVATTGLKLCTGVAQFIMYDNFELKPTGTLNCVLSGNVSVAQLFGEPEGVVYKNEDMSQYKNFGKVQRKRNPAELIPDTATFNPPRPSFLGPIIQNPDEYKDFVFKEASQVQGLTKDGQSFQGAGEWFIKVLDVGASFRPEGYTGPLDFNSVIVWEIKGTGFENTPRGSFMAFESMVYHFNVKPQLSIPQIEIKTKLSEVAGSLGASGGIIKSLGDMLFSGVTITLRLREHNPL